MLHLYNTLSGEKEEFIPLEENKVGMYICGVTLYDHIHIGHLKSMLTFELLRNYFQYKGKVVTLVRNITDIDDKIIAKAHDLHIDPLTLVNEYVENYHALLLQLEINPPEAEPRVTQYLQQIEQYISILEKKGFAYKTTDGIYFDTSKIKSPIYPLSGKIIKDLQVSEDNAHYHKKNSSDFALWKQDNNYGYDSQIFPTKGRPGWHIECSAMHHHTLGEQFDIHGGGRDLIFPHHENEITQSMAHNNVMPANYWLHNGMMTRDGKKLSKSLGNSIYVHELLKDYSAEALKLFLLKGHYRQSQEFSIEELNEANVRINSFMRKLNQIEDLPYFSFIEEVIELLEDDLNTPQVVVLLYKKFKEFQLNLSKGLAIEILEVLKLLSVVGKTQTLSSLYDKFKVEIIIPSEVNDLILKRNNFKIDKNWTMADDVRNQLKKLGWKLTDKKDGSYKIEKIE
jgi:cysteinyl-tRNA synthetase